MLTLLGLDKTNYTRGAGARQWRGGIVMPLTMAKTGEENLIKRIGGRAETRRFLENLGFVEGGTITVVAEIAGNVIVRVKDARVAVSREMARNIMV